MKTKRKKNKTTAQPMLRVPSTHSFVGTWIQEPDPNGTTTVSYSVFLKDGKFGVSGVDEEDGQTLQISSVKLDGTKLRFTSFYPPGQHRANHVLNLQSQKKMTHLVSGIYADGESFKELEVWVKKSTPKARTHTR